MDLNKNKSEGGGALSVNEPQESFVKFGGTTVTSGSGNILYNSAATIDDVIIITINKGKSPFYRNHYNISGTFTWSGVGATRVSASGYLNSGTLASLILTPSAGALTGSYTTIHYY